MAWTRLRSIGFELNTIDEVTQVTYNGSLAPVISTTAKKTGANSIRWQVNTNPAGVVFPANYKLVRTSFHINHNGVTATAGRRAIICALQLTPSFTGITWHGDTDTINIYLNGSIVATTSAATLPFYPTNAWTHMGVVFYAHATNGYISLYMEGSKVLTYTGNTGTGGVGVFYMGGFHSVGGAWNSSLYIDDVVVEYDPAELEADEPPPSCQFLWAVPSADASPNQFAVTGAASNYLAVDDPTPDGDATFVYADGSGFQERYTLTVPSIPTGYKVTGVTMTVLAKRTNTGVNSTIDLALEQATSSYGSSQLPVSSYRPIQSHFKNQVNGNAWSAAAIAAAKWGFRSSGTF